MTPLSKELIEKMSTKNNPQYDRLYESTGQLWPSRPGRMVKEATKRLAPGKCLDLGCGDGKNYLYLEKKGWYVDGVEVSELALAAARKRMEAASLKPKGRLLKGNAASFTYEPDAYDLVVCYGLYHCLDEEEVKVTHGGLMRSLKQGGLIAYAAFNDELPIPEGHGTYNDRIYLRGKNHIFDLAGGSVNVLKAEFGQITEDHLPVIGKHNHSLTWALLEKR